MEVLFLLIPVSLAMAVGFTIACLRSIRAGQFDDMESPAWRILFDSNASDARIPLDENSLLQTIPPAEKISQRSVNP